MLFETHATFLTIIQPVCGVLNRYRRELENAKTSMAGNALRYPEYYVTVSTAQETLVSE